MPQRQLQTVLFDLDDCLYRVPEMPELVRENIQLYMQNKLGIASEQVPDICLTAYSDYGTTMAGLVATGYAIDYDDWHQHVHHSLPYEKYLKHDDALRKMLQQIPLPKYVFTNGDQKHAEICLRLLGISDCFKGVICFESIMRAAESKGFVHEGTPIICKPSFKAIELALEQAGGAKAESSLFLDDSTRNIAAGHQKGLATVLVGRTGMNTGADAEVYTLADIPTVAPQIWQMMTAKAPSANGVKAVHSAVDMSSAVCA